MTLGMPAFKVTYHNGKSYITSMAKGITLADAKRYFLGNWIEQPDEKTMLQVVKVEQVRENPRRRYRRNGKEWYVKRADGKQYKVGGARQAFFKIGRARHVARLIGGKVVKHASMRNPRRRR